MSPRKTKVNLIVFIVFTASQEVKRHVAHETYVREKTRLTRSVAPRDLSPVECRANFNTLKILINLNT